MRSILYAVFAVLAVSFTACLSLAMPSYADPGLHVHLDSIAHASQTTDCSKEPVLAFAGRALIHDRYSAGGFTLMRCDARS